MRRELETEPRRVLIGHEGETPDTAKEPPTGHRASSQPYQWDVPDLKHFFIEAYADPEWKQEKDCPGQNDDKRNGI